MKLLHIYPELMNLYGEYANVRVLERFLREQGVPVTVDTLDLYDERDISDYDFYYMGAGTEKNAVLALGQLLKHRAALTAAQEAGRVLLFTGNAWQLLGKSITDAKGRCRNGLNLAEFDTLERDTRIVCDAVAYFGDKPLVGFINKCSVTRRVQSPFAQLALGFGNTDERGAEGWHERNAFGTHLTGPILVKNPAFLREIASLLLGRTLPDDTPMWQPMERAYAVALDALSRRIG